MKAVRGLYFVDRCRPNTLSDSEDYTSYPVDCCAAVLFPLLHRLALAAVARYARPCHR